jgi:putative phage-type endonuclease
MNKEEKGILIEKVARWLAFKVQAQPPRVDLKPVPALQDDSYYMSQAQNESGKFGWHSRFIPLKHSAMNEIKEIKEENEQAKIACEPHKRKIFQLITLLQQELEKMYDLKSNVIFEITEDTTSKEYIFLKNCCSKCGICEEKVPLSIKLIIDVTGKKIFVYDFEGERCFYDMYPPENEVYEAANGLKMHLNYQPETYICDITKISNKYWVLKRSDAFGGSDNSVVAGISPFSTLRDLILTKRGVKPMYEPEETWVAKEFGHRNEELVAMLFYEKYGCRPYKVDKMFRHPEYYWMQADVDYFVDIPDENGEMRTYILEIKTCSYQSKEKWGTDYAPTIPLGYQLQGRHYNAVTNTSGVIYACLFDNNEASLIVRKMERDLEKEAELIESLRYVWQEYVEKEHTLPPYTEMGTLVLDSVRKWNGLPKKSKTVTLDGSEETADGSYTVDELIKEWETLTSEKTKLCKQKKDVEDRITFIKACIEELSGGVLDGKIICTDGKSYHLKDSVRKSCRISKDKIEKMKLIDVSLYNEMKSKGYICESESHSLDLKAIERRNDG